MCVLCLDGIHRFHTEDIHKKFPLHFNSIDIEIGMNESHPKWKWDESRSTQIYTMYEYFGKIVQCGLCHPEQYKHLTIQLIWKIN